ncbi:MAG: Rieske 2Fe-2S domain-containing protein, partial [Actinobacteria bacterium]|nr:Rieske 2Fe-2S domain-containing protein [Actinomycetota bacterium]
MSPVVVCTLDQLDEDFPLVAQVDGVEVAIVLTQGALYAIKNECSHADVALSEGEVDDCHLECWMHGSR